MKEAGKSKHRLMRKPYIELTERGADINHCNKKRKKTKPKLHAEESEIDTEKNPGLYRRQQIDNEKRHFDNNGITTPNGK